MNPFFVLIGFLLFIGVFAFLIFLAMKANKTTSINNFNKNVETKLLDNILDEAILKLQNKNLPCRLLIVGIGGVPVEYQKRQRPRVNTGWEELNIQNIRPLDVEDFSGQSRYCMGTYREIPVSIVSTGTFLSWNNEKSPSIIMAVSDYNYGVVETIKYF